MNDQEKVLFHYTSLDGLLGITSSASIWATNILYLNDASELNYSRELLKQELSYFRKTLTKNRDDLIDSVEIVFFEILEENVDKLMPSENFSFFVCSFSEEEDLLSQWRGYCPKGIGFSLGFKFQMLKECAEQSKFSLKQCIYEEKEQISAIRTLIKKTSEKFNDEIKKSSDWGNAWDTKGKLLAADFMLEFIRLAPIFKHPKFIEEREWRIIASLQTKKVKETIQYRIGKTMIIPYIEFFLPTQEGKLLINQIVVGPTNEPLLSKASVEMLLKSRMVNYGDVSFSSIPFRSW